MCLSDNPLLGFEELYTRAATMGSHGQGSYGGSTERTSRRCTWTVPSPCCDERARGAVSVRSLPNELEGKTHDTPARSIPDSESARAASKAYASHPHLAGSPEDFDDAKVILKLFQTELGIATPSSEPIFSAGTPDSRNATLGLTSVNRSSTPSAWIDVYYPYLDTPLDRSLEILGEDGNAVWTADLVEDGDPLDEDAHKYRDAIKAWHGYSAHGEAEGQVRHCLRLYDRVD